MNNTDLKEKHWKDLAVNEDIVERFSWRIQNAEHQEGFKQPELPKYDETEGDPNNHVMEFKSRLVLWRKDDALLCKLFPATLKGEGSFAMAIGNSS
ncbi:hypothetical protein IFM89_015532 [Coptis chinensis]|uniref:Uncharacterized protein n=1 Tax=Coptis chinensis TaxID=261450 RepID=A0A835MA28_9MAGN|nr:hypothetical protein IFM89_015532 [Coptis chinensis]